MEPLRHLRPLPSTTAGLRSTFDRLPYGCLLFMYRLDLTFVLRNRTGTRRRSRVFCLDLRNPGPFRYVPRSINFSRVASSLTKLDHTRCACLRAAGGQRRRSQVQRVLHTALPLAPLSLLSRSAPSAFDQRTRSPRRTSAAPLASRCCPRLTRRARAPCAHTC